MKTKMKNYKTGDIVKIKIQYQPKNEYGYKRKTVEAIYLNNDEIIKEYTNRFCMPDDENDKKIIIRKKTRELINQNKGKGDNTYTYTGDTNQAHSHTNGYRDYYEEYERIESYIIALDGVPMNERFF